MFGFRPCEPAPFATRDGVRLKSSSGLNNSSGTVPSESVRRPERSQNTLSSSLSMHESRIYFEHEIRQF